MSNKVKDITGLKAGLLTAVSFVGIAENGRAVWLCRCECGNEVERLSSIMCNASAKSKKSHCGCEPAGKTHGLSKEKHLYWVWASIIQRCENEINKDFTNYGGRGITICKEWRNDFGTFHAWAKSTGYKRGLTIERVDVNKNYNPENCDWIENEKQSLNRRHSAMLTYKGETKHLSDWAREYGINYKTLRGRIFDYGWSVDRSLGENNANT